MQLAEFITRYGEGITKRIAATLTPRYQPHRDNQPLPALKRPPIQAQKYAIQAAALSMKINPGTMLVGEMGTGKTGIATAAAKLAGKTRILALCPSHLTTNWQNEIRQTLNCAQIDIVSTVTQLEKALAKPATKERPHFVIMPQSAAALSWGWQGAVHWQPKRPPPYLKDEYPVPGQYRVPRCVNCHHTIVDDQGNLITQKQLNAKRRSCEKCGEPLWQAGRVAKQKQPKISLATYIKKRHSGRFDLLILDEVHEYKGQDTARGISAGVLSEVCRHTLSLTGTLMGGYSSTIFHLLYRHSKTLRSRFKHNDLRRWIHAYGFEETIKSDPKDPDAIYAHGKASTRRFNRSKTQEKPGISPKALYHLLDNTIFLRMEDVSTKLPPYREQVVTIPLSDQVQTVANLDGSPLTTTQAQAYHDFHQEMYKEIKKHAYTGSRKYLSAYLQSMLAWPDAPWRREVVVDPDKKPDPNEPDAHIVSQAPALSESFIYPKEQALLELARQEKQAGRPLLVYVTHTDQRDITPRLKQLLNDHGCRATVLKAGSPPAKLRREWIENQVKKGLDVLICNPRLVQTGLNLTQFPTIAWYQTDYSVYTTRQASRRSWRIGQTNPVKVLFFTYENTLQLQALQLVSKKMKCSLAIEGDLPEEGLSAFAGEEEDLLVTLAREMLLDQEANGTTPAASLERILEEARQDRELEGDFIVADDWDLPPPQEPDADQTQTIRHQTQQTVITRQVIDLEQLRQLSLTMTSIRGKPRRNGGGAVGAAAAVATKAAPASQDLFSYKLLTIAEQDSTRLNAADQTAAADHQVDVNSFTLNDADAG